MDPLPFVIATIVALVGSGIAPLFMRPVLVRLGVTDVPNARSSHTRVTIRGGGVAPLIGVVVAGVIALVIMGPDDEVLPLVVTLAVGVLVAAVGFWEDLRGVRSLVRAGLQVLVGSVAAIVLGALLGAPGWAVLLAAFVFVAYVNFANFMDGVNGISAFHGLAAGGFFAVAGFVIDIPWLAIGGGVVAAAFVVFLPWNVKGAGMFLGDVGSYLLGAWLITLAIAAWFWGVPLVAALSPLAIYLADATFTIAQRASRGEAIFQAHRTHAYQRLTDTGMSHLAVAVTVAAFSLASSLVGIGVLAGVLAVLPAAILIAATSAAYLVLPRLRGSRLPARQGPLPPFSITIPQATQSPSFAPQTWAVVGASGFIGSAVVRKLRAEGLTVVSIAAPRVELSPNEADATAIAELARSGEAVTELTEGLAGADVVVNAAGMAAPDAGATSTLYGANALLPAIVAVAAERAGVARYVHLSSAAVQGRRVRLDESLEVAPFSPYSRSKAVGERAVLTAAQGASVETVVIRATSVQGPGRPTTESLRRLARSRLSTVAKPGTQPTVVSSVDGLVDFVHQVGAHMGRVPAVLLQPWEGLSARDVLLAAGGRPPRELPRWLCRLCVAGGRLTGRFVPEIAGLTRRVELMWFGQAQQPSTLTKTQVDSNRVRMVLAGDVSQ